MMKPSEFQTTIENQFDYICKVAMEDERKDYLKALSRQCKRETLFCDMDDYTVNLFSSEDTYPSHFHTFEMDGFTVRIENSLLVLWSSIFVTLMANKIGGLQFGIYRNCQISSRVFHTAVAALPLTKANRSDFE